MRPHATFFLSLLAVVAGCATPMRVVHVGGMREVMREGKTEARAQLADHRRAGEYGVGALTGLQGELVIDDGEALVATGTPENVTVAGPAATATLLTTAVVPQWREMTLAADSDLAAIEEQIAAAMHGAGESELVPFVVLGQVRDLSLHVVRGACPHGDVPPGQEPARFRSTIALPVRLIGFFAPGQEGIMTHHGTALHVHAIVTAGAGRRAMGHLDSATVLAGARLLLPAGR